GRDVVDEDELPVRRLREIADRGAGLLLLAARGEEPARGERGTGQTGAGEQAAARHRTEIESVGRLRDRGMNLRHLCYLLAAAARPGSGGPTSLSRARPAA